MQVARFDLGLGLNVSTGYGSNTLRLSDGSILTSWMLGQADRLVRINPKLGSSQVIKNPHAGLLSAVVESYPGGPVWALCEFGLVELSLEPFAVMRRLSARIGKYSSRLVRIDDHTLGVSKRFAKTSALVDIERFTVAGRLAVPSPEVSAPSRSGTTLFSFAFGKARSIGPDLRVVEKHDVPIGSSPLHTRRGIAFLPGSYSTSSRFNYLQIFGAAPVDSVGSIAFLNPIDLTLTAGPAQFPIQQIHDTDPAGRIFATDNNAAELPSPQGGRTVFLLDPTGQNLIDTAEVQDRIYHVAACGPGEALVSHFLDTTGRITAGPKRHFTHIRASL